jgi:hypothetical protein
MTRNCYRCDAEIADPVRENASYVRGDDTTETVERERLVEQRHSDYTRAIRDRVIETHDLNPTQANNVIARNDGAWLQDGMSHDVSDGAFERNETVDPSKPEQDPAVVRVDSEQQEVEEQRTGLVCPDCVQDTDEVIW